MCSPKLAICVIDFNDDHSNCMWSSEFPSCKDKLAQFQKEVVSLVTRLTFSRQFHKIQIGDDAEDE
jgi:hypothetical protein